MRSRPSHQLSGLILPYGEFDLSEFTLFILIHQAFDGQYTGPGAIQQRLSPQRVIAARRSTLPSNVNRKITAPGPISVRNGRCIAGLYAAHGD